jgi:hypothetical protein
MRVRVFWFVSAKLTHEHFTRVLDQPAPSAVGDGAKSVLSGSVHLHFAFHHTVQDRRVASRCGVLGKLKGDLRKLSIQKDRYLLCGSLKFSTPDLTVQHSKWFQLDAI